MAKRSDREVFIFIMANQLGLTVEQFIDNVKMGHNEQFDKRYKHIAKIRLHPLDDWRKDPTYTLMQVGKQFESITYAPNKLSNERTRQIVSGKIFWKLFRYYAARFNGLRGGYAHPDLELTTDLLPIPKIR